MGAGEWKLYFPGASYFFLQCRGNCISIQLLTFNTYVRYYLIFGEKEVVYNRVLTGIDIVESGLFP